MSRFVLTPAAVADIEAILARTDEPFGSKARVHYEKLLVKAIADLAKTPDRGGSRRRPEIASRAMTYDLQQSDDRVSAAAGRVKKTHYFLLYRVRGDGVVEIGRVLHDSMDLDRHLPKDYQPGKTDWFNE